MIICNENNWNEYFDCSIPKLINSRIELSSKDNILICEDGVVLQNSVITFVGNGNIVYLSKNAYPYNVNIRIYNNSVLFIDENNYFNGRLNFLVQEHQNIILGRDNIFSYGIFIMTSDAHLIYDVESGKRINHSKSIFIGDHVWIGQYSTILKGTIIGSGAIIGASSVVSGKRCSSNSVWGGNPAKRIKSNIFWKKDCTNLFSAEKSEEYEVSAAKDFVYENDRCPNWNEIDQKLKKEKSMKVKLNILLQEIRANNSQNRFFE